MEGLVKNLFGGKPAGSQAPSAGDDDFADFAGVPDPTPASFAAVPSGASDGGPALNTQAANLYPYTKWYRVWERTSPKDFLQEAFVIPFIIIAVVIHKWGSRKNRRIAKGWMQAHVPVLEQEYAVVGFGGPRAPSLDEVETSGLAQAMASPGLVIPEQYLKEKTAQEYTTYATGRQNVAFTDIKLTLLQRYNQLSLAGQYVLSFFFESFPVPTEELEAVTYPFDGKESQIVPAWGGENSPDEKRKGASASTFDGFVWAVVHKKGIKRLRDERYDISLTSTKDHAKLPFWATVMSEAGEITDTLLTPQLIAAIESAGDRFNYLIITDQALDKPKVLDETIPKKRIQLSTGVPSSSDNYESTLPIFSYFLRLPDILVSSARFRAEVTKKIRQTRDEQIKRLQKEGEGEKAEERALKRDKDKKEKRDAKLKGLSADEQRKFLDKEREKEQRKMQKRVKA